MWLKHEPGARECFSNITVFFSENPRNVQASWFVYGDFELAWHKIINYVIIYIEFQPLIDPVLLVWQLVAISYPMETDYNLLNERGTSIALEQNLSLHSRCLLGYTKCSPTVCSLHLFIPPSLSSFLPFFPLPLSLSSSVRSGMGLIKEYSRNYKIDV